MRACRRALGHDVSKPSRVDELIEELKEGFPQKLAEVERYVTSERFGRLKEAQKVEALTILKSALDDARKKAGA